MLVAGGKKFKILEGREDAFEAMFMRLSDEIAAKEHGTLFYKLCRVRGEPLTYFLLEIFQDEEARIAHASAPHMWAAMPQLLSFLDGELEFHYFDPAENFRKTIHAA